MEEKSAPIDDFVVLELLLQLRADRARKLEFVGAVVEGVILAVEQVQEVRIASLEAGPPQDAGRLVADVFWGFLFDSAVNALWAGLFLRSIHKLSLVIRAIDVRRRKMATARSQAAKELFDIREKLYGGFSARSGAESSFTRSLLEGMERIEKKGVIGPSAWREGTVHLRRVLDDQIDELNKETAIGKRDVISSLAVATTAVRNLRVHFEDKESDVRSLVAASLEQLAGKVRAYLGDAAPASTGIASTDLLSSTYDWGSRQRQQIILTYDQLEIVLQQSGSAGDAAAVCLLLGATSDVTPDDYSQVRSRAWLLCEAVIWAEVLRDALLGSKEPLASANNVLEQYSVPTNIAKYLTDRFQSEARAWATSEEAQLAVAAPQQSELVNPSGVRAAVHSAAVRALKAARTQMQGELTTDEWYPFEKRSRPEGVSSAAVRAYLLAMLHLYRRNASAFLGAVSAYR